MAFSNSTGPSCAHVCGELGLTMVCIGASECLMFRAPMFQYVPTGGHSRAPYFLCAGLQLESAPFRHNSRAKTALLERRAGARTPGRWRRRGPHSAGPRSHSAAWKLGDLESSHIVLAGTPDRNRGIANRHMGYEASQMGTKASQMETKASQIGSVQICMPVGYRLVFQIRTWDLVSVAGTALGHSAACGRRGRTRPVPE